MSIVNDEIDDFCFIGKCEMALWIDSMTDVVLDFYFWVRLCADERCSIGR